MRSSRVAEIGVKKCSQIQIEPNRISEHWHSTVSHTHAFPRSLGRKSWMERTQTANAKNSFSRAEPRVGRWHTNENEQSSSSFWFFSSILVGCRRWKEMFVVVRTVTSVTVSRYVARERGRERKSNTGSHICSCRRGQKNQTKEERVEKTLISICADAQNFPHFSVHEI